MAYPSSGTTVSNRPDLGSAFEFSLTSAAKNFIGTRVLRTRLVGSQKADVGKIPLEALLQSRETARAPGAGYSRSDFEFEKFSFETAEHGAEEVLDDRTLAMYKDLLDAEQVHAARAVDAVARKFETQAAAKIYDTSVWTGSSLTTALTNEWDDSSNCTPIAEIEAARLKVITSSGLVPNCLVCNRRQFFHLKNCAEIIDRIKYAGVVNPINVTEAALAQALDLDFVVVAGGIKNTANEAQAASLASIWSDEYAMVCRVAVSDDPQEPCIGRTFMWEDENVGYDREEIGVIIEEYREDNTRSSVIRARADWDQVVMYPQAGHLLSNVITI